MSAFVVNVPETTGIDAFFQAVDSAATDPKPDARTKLGKKQRDVIEHGKDALSSLADVSGNEDGTFSGTVSGKLKDGDGSYTVTVTLAVK